MTQREPIKVLGDVIAGYMGLRNSGPLSQIMLTSERFTIPPNNDIYIALGYIDGKAIGNNASFDGNTLIETSEVTMLYHVQIDIMSFGPDARTRKEEVFMALRSSLAQSAMETNNIQFARMPAGFVNAQSLEESKMLNRFTMSIAITALITKDTPVTQYYNQFPFQFDENDGGQSPILTPEDPFNG